MSLLRGFVSKSSSHAMGDYVSKVTTYIKLESIEDFFDIAPIQKMIDSLDVAKLNAEDQLVLRVFREALERREKGISDDW